MKTYFGLFNVLLAAFLISTPLHAEDKSTKDFSFLIGTWSVEATVRLNSDSPITATGERVCAYYLNEDYVKCETQRSYSSGRSGVSSSLHNYNHLYGYYESIYLSSGWPIKPFGKTTISKDGDAIFWVNEFEFQTGDGRTENVRAEITVSGDVMETEEFIMLSTPGKEGEYELAYRERSVRK